MALCMIYLFQFLKKCRTTPDTVNSWENLFCGEIDDCHCRSVCVQNVFFILALLGFKDSDNATLTVFHKAPFGLFIPILELLFVEH
jgi:hypothetical protein